MEYEKTLLNLIERVNELEDKVKALESLLGAHHNEDSNRTLSSEKEKTVKKTRVSKRMILQDLTTKLQSQNINYKVITGGIETTYHDHHPLKVLLTVSRDYGATDDYQWRSWLTINKDYLTQFDALLMAIKKNDGHIVYFILNQNELSKVLAKKQIDKAGIYHFYIDKTKDGGILDIRDIPYIDMDIYLNNWQALKNNEGDHSND